MKLSVIFPSKNQSAKLLKNIKEKGLPFYDKLGIAYEFLIVSDGGDATNQKILEEGMKDLPMQVRLLPYEPQKGKGHNVSRGIEASTGDYCMFMDADFATDLKAISPIISTLGSHDCYIASRYNKDSVITLKAPLLRRLMSYVSRKLIKWRFHFKGITDTQCGYKIFRTSIAKEMAKRSKITAFAFDVEYLYFLSLNGFSIKEIPCVWTDDPNSTVGAPIKASILFIRDLCVIKRHKKSYILTPQEKKALLAPKNEKGLSR